MSHKPRILLTGATGFVGKAILAQLVQQNYPVMVLGRNPQRISALPAVQMVACTLENITPDVTSAIHAFAPHMLIHAAWIGTENTNRNNSEFVLANLQSTLTLFEVSVAAGSKRFIAFGSQAEYSDGLKSDISEAHPTFPKTPYGIAKLATCHLLQALALSSHIECVWLRLFACYGDEYTASYVMPYLAQCFKKQEMPIFKTPHAVWDYIHVNDVAAATVAATRPQAIHGIFNLGTGIGHSVGDIALMLAKNCAFKDRDGLRHAIDNSRDLPTRRVANIDAISTALSWKPTLKLELELEKITL